MRKVRTGIYALLFAVSCFHASAQTKNRHTLSGYIRDASSGEILIGAGISIAELGKGTTSNEYGFYSLTLGPGQYTLVVSYLGYEAYKDSLSLTKDIHLNINLRPVVKQMEVTVTSDRSKENVQGTQMGTENLSIEKIKTLPVILGEVDILKTLQLLPGVQSSGEGSSGFYVRGGGPDQNLVLLDEAIVYNPGHLFGFFSVFNSDAINNTTLIKGGMPAEYGGRLSSVVNVSMKEGNNQAFKATGGIGLIASRLTLEGPVQKGKSSFMVAGRRTYIDVLTKPIAEKGSNLAGSGYYFYDLNTKINYTFSDKDRIFLSGYFGRDKFTYKGDRFTIEFPWGNTTTSLRWNHLFNNKLFMNTTALFSDYAFTLGAKQNEFDFKLFSGIRDYNLKADLDYFPNIRHQVKFGGLFTYHIFTPSTATGNAGDVSLAPEKINKQYGREAALYFSDDFDLTEKLRINAGLRYSLFQQIGPYDRYIESEDGEFSDTVVYAKNENIAFYDGWEPRFAIRYQLDLQSSVKASFTKTNQYLHLASTSGSTLPADLWIPSSRRVKPQECTQYAIGYFRNFLNDVFETSVEIYYKDLKNQIEFREGENTPGFNNNVENAFTFGDGRSYGSEFFIKKQSGKLNGWIGYTLSYALRYFDGLNGGHPFFAKYDRRHDGSVVISYSLSEKWTLGSVFVYGSGSAFSLPAYYVFISNTPGLYYEEDYRNKYRLKPYHRLDLSATYYHKKTEKRESSWNFSIYNVYNRLNQYMVFLDVQGNIANGQQTTQAKQVTIFPVIPSITWNFRF